MRRLLFMASLCAGAPAFAEDCPSFALDSTYLHGFFCGQLDQIIGPKTRQLPPTNPITTAEDVDEAWLSIPAIRDAYRVDPGRTLDMIQRIKAAGGEPVQ